MDIRTASGGQIVVETRQGKTRFRPLSVADLGDLQALVPGEDQRFVTVFELHKWAQTVEGCDHVILASLRHIDSTATIQQVRALGPLLNRVQLSRLIMSESLMSGEEPVSQEDQPAPKAEASNATG